MRPSKPPIKKALLSWLSLLFAAQLSLVAVVTVLFIAMDLIVYMWGENKEMSSSTVANVCRFVLVRLTLKQATEPSSMPTDINGNSAISSVVTSSFTCMRTIDDEEDERLVESDKRSNSQQREQQFGFCGWGFSPPPPLPFAASPSRERSPGLGPVRSNGNHNSGAAAMAHSVLPGCILLDDCSVSPQSLPICVITKKKCNPQRVAFSSFTSSSATSSVDATPLPSPASLTPGTVTPVNPADGEDGVMSPLVMPPPVSAPTALQQTGSHLLAPAKASSCFVEEAVFPAVSLRQSSLLPEHVPSLPAASSQMSVGGGGAPCAVIVDAAAADIAAEAADREHPRATTPPSKHKSRHRHHHIHQQRGRGTLT
mmetsp:Transcript_12837/g.25349  ORF Transcript_12837/g.25349 Transcript_12837/m.25349 type:complete len:369 (-) Transcript_12837:140-1246(-)|eukprot:CAMPEP_0171963964 /NCGR_PEP_ID=MMETSP0993-20121228/178805_1 /TAXON_ID=483369 /ORGANISM="non described non described, Strain CCMP2098" /LENGTH=368 /DNA_ID=CAMNT_0012612697 /DNA_START=128 /DNA_END=1234 /DNA_ORIENTATION=-